MRRRRGHSGRRRQFSRSRRGVSLRPRVQSAHDGQRAGPGGKHVALPDRSDLRDLEHRAHDRDGDRCAERRARRQSRARTVARPPRRPGNRGCDPQRVSVRRRRSCDRMAARLRGAGQGGLRRHRNWSGRGVPAPSQLQSSVPGVFAVGDVRSGSVKRVGGAIGEGAQVVAAIHKFLGNANVPHL